MVATGGLRNPGLQKSANFRIQLQVLLLFEGKNILYMLDIYVILSVIKSFKDKETEKIFNQVYSKKITYCNSIPGIKKINTN